MEQIFIYILIAILGLCVGSFLNVVIYRVPNNMSISFPASHCPTCSHKLKWYDNIPIISFLILGGKCRYCKTKISPRYILIEILNCVLWLTVALIFWRTSIVVAICYMVAISTLLCVCFIDLNHKFIPDRFQIILLILGVILTIFASDMIWYERLIGFAVGGGIMLFFYGLGYLLFKREAMGIGDIKLMAVCGLLIGWQSILLALLVGTIFGSIVLMILKRRTEQVEFAFAPYLAFGIIVALLWGEKIITTYISLFS